MTTNAPTPPHLELVIARGHGLWEQGYHAGFDDGCKYGRQEGDERRFWLGVFTGVLLVGFAILIALYVGGVRL